VTIANVEPLQLGQILGSLLAAVVDAEKHAARASVDFMGEVGFLRDEATGVDRLRMVTFRYRKRDETGQPAEFEAEIPLLAMVSVPTLGVRKATIAFGYDVVTAESVTQEDQPTPISGQVRPALLEGYVRRKSQLDTRSQTSIDVDVTIERGDLPIGIERAFELAELSIATSTRPEGEA
jgi:hypothetical protein